MDQIKRDMDGSWSDGGEDVGRRGEERRYRGTGNLGIKSRQREVMSELLLLLSVVAESEAVL